MPTADVPPLAKNSHGGAAPPPRSACGFRDFLFGLLSALGRSAAATRCIQVRGDERVWSNRTLRRLSPSSSNMESKRSFWVASVVQLRAIAKRTVARRTEMSVDIPSATQAAEYVRHCCPLIMEALPRTTARPPAQHWCAPPIIACRGNFNLGCAALSPAVCAPARRSGMGAAAPLFKRGVS